MAEKKLTRTLCLRLSERDYQRVVSLRVALEVPTDSELIRTLLWVKHRTIERTLSRRKRSTSYRERVKAEVDGKQLDWVKRLEVRP